MRLSQALLPEFDQEMATTRKLLERVPDDRADWKPHDKSMALGRLATHVAEIPRFVHVIVNDDGLDLGSRYAPKNLATRQEILDLFDESVRAAREQIGNADNEALMQHWTLRKGEHVVFTLPRAAVLRAMVFSHIIHHRGQLSVYLRLNDVPVPSIYGPSADETF